MRLLDADTISFLHRGDARVLQRLAECTDPEISVGIVTKSEVLRARIEYLLKAANAEHVLRAQTLLQRSEKLLDGLKLVSFDSRAATEFERLRSMRKVQSIGHVDLMAASIALANDATFVTRNLKDFRQIPGLKLENWID
jgi:tRNA(fMet)-specific endonuclease VapC